MEDGMSDRLLNLLDELGDAHEAYATSVGQTETQAMEERVGDIRHKILCLAEIPTEPTEAQLHAAAEFVVSKEMARAVYRAMIAALREDAG
jgi:hypothetical protein